MAYPRILGDDPINMLLGGSGIIVGEPKQRVYEIRDVSYDDSMTPVYATPKLYQDRYDSIDALKSANPYCHALFDSPILDLDHYLKIYEP